MQNMINVTGRTKFGTELYKFHLKYFNMLIVILSFSAMYDVAIDGNMYIFGF